MIFPFLAFFALIYPNPVTGLLNIANSEGAILELYNCVGNLILTAIIENNTQSVDMSSLNNGIYFVRMNNHGLATSQKVIKQ